MIGASLAAAATLAVQPVPAVPPSSIELARRYWVAMNWGRHASNRLCSLGPVPRYDDPDSPFRPIDQRLRAVAQIITARDDKAMTLGRAGIVIAPPNSVCDDPEGAREALATFERLVSELEELTGVAQAGN